MANALKEWYWSVRRHGLRQVVGEQASALGARIHVERLMYNRVVMETFANHGAAAAPVFAKAILSVWPDVRSMADGITPMMLVRLPAASMIAPPTGLPPKYHSAAS